MAVDVISLVATPVIVSICYFCGYVLYNLYLHPLAKVPGPRWAAVTSLWLFFKEMHGDGHDQIYHLHKKYGPLIRIRPNEIAINDIEPYINSIYTQSTKFTKAPFYYNAFDFPRSNLFSETSTDVHSQEKRLMSQAFSRKNVLGMQDTFYDSVEQWIAQIKTFILGGKAIPLWHATQCLTLEASSRFSYGSSDGALETNDFAHPIFLTIERFASLFIIFQYFPILRQIALLVQRLMPSGLPDINKGAAEGLVRLREKKMVSEHTGMIMFDNMMEKAQKNGISLNYERLVSNGGLMLAAGTGTTAASLTTAIYHLAAKPELWKTLQDDLEATCGSEKRPNVTTLESVPLLESCVKEAIRVAVPVRGRHPRVVPAGGFTYKDQHFAEGTILSGNPLNHCLDPIVFPEPFEFRPERWLVADTTVMQKFNVPFTRGTRNCIGQNIAQIELKIALCQVVLQFDPVEVIDVKLEYAEYGGTTSCKTLVPVKLRLR